MNRLLLELHRLYQPDPRAEPAADGPPVLIGPDGQVRALVLGLTRPADWAVLSRVWQGVQADLGLPAPAIAVDGQAGLQLWFSLAEPWPAAAAAAWLEDLRRRYLADIAPARVALWPRANDAEAAGWRHAGAVPALQPDGERWAAFVAPDLAAVFADEPWIDLPPNLDGQAQLLARLTSIRPEDASALQQAAPAHAENAVPTPAQAAPPPAPDTNDPRQFLQRVMNDETVPLALRIDAAKALLTAAGGPASRG